jgi:hypothetical protein
VRKNAGDVRESSFDLFFFETFDTYETMMMTASMVDLQIGAAA